MSKIARFGISMDESLLARFDKYIGEKEYANRSEAIRDLVREKLVQDEWQDSEKLTVGTITLIYDHHQRDLTDKLTRHQHDEHDVVISSMHVHLDHHNCLEVLAVRGKPSTIQKIADKLISTKGVKHGKLVMTSTGRDL
ncbi:nickel-responsive transcriptional regulator NikR [candidate division KSB1 bacterium]|nr:nickel-responsive transcriptional regulator NikR [candidate division KSB1 bacterium]